MADASHFSQPQDEHSEPVADSLLESEALTASSECVLEASPAEVAEAAATEDLRIERLQEIATEEAADEAPERQPEEVATNQIEAVRAASTPAREQTEIEIDWEAEVEAFVRAEQGLQEGARADAHLESDRAENTAGEISGACEPLSVESPSESGEVVQGLDEACRILAGAICASETDPAEANQTQNPNACGEPDSGTAKTSLDLEALPKSADINPTCADASIIEEEKPASEHLHATAAGSQFEALVEPAAIEKSKKFPWNPADDRRKKRRAMISAPVRVRGVNVTNGGPDEISTTIDVSRNGILFASSATGYYKGMEVAVIFPYSTAPTAIHAEQTGRVVRIGELPDGRPAVAIALGLGVGEDLVDACGRKLAGTARIEMAQGGSQQAPDRPRVLVMDPELAVRTSVKSILEMEGYQVIAVGNITDAKRVLEMCVPALVIAEVQGENVDREGLPGFDLCAYIKETQPLKRVPVVLTTQSAYPSDYSNAHSLGAIVCMAKPYKQERLGHIAKLLAPLQAHKEAPPVKSCKADPKRKACATPHSGAGRAPVTKMKYDENTKVRPKYRFPSFR